MNDYEAHLSSYDHSHKQRLKDMKAMVRDPNAGAKARKAEAKETGLVSIKLAGQEEPASGNAGGFKKGGFKKSGFKSAFAPSGAQPGPGPAEAVAAATRESSNHPSLKKTTEAESDTDDEGYEVYDPRFPTD